MILPPPGSTRTAPLFPSTPLFRSVPGRAPVAFFSALKPGTHIPPHNGATNTRLTVHMPLVIPPDCALRVGDETRTWEPGKLLMFDDTIRHEAWNYSDRSEEHTSELQSLMRISYAVFCLKKKTNTR